MSTTIPIDTDAAWAAFDVRDRAHDGRFVVAVSTTHIYCKPSCPARHPKREHVAFYHDGAEARAAGYRACLRCKPDEVGRDRIAVAAAVALIEASEDAIPLEVLAAEVGYAPHHFHRLFKRATGVTPAALIEASEDAIPLEVLAAEVGYAPHHFHRLFKRATGVTPAAYARGRRAARVAEALREEDSVTQAIYEAGYSAPSRFYEDGAQRLGMTPSAWRDGGVGVTIRWTIADTSLGKLMIAATDKGLCRVAFDEDAMSLAHLFPKAEIAPGGAALALLAARVVAQVESPDRDHDLPLDVQGTAFQEAVWQALRTIPAGETVSYAQRADGSPGGYAWGLDRKAALQQREGGR